MDPSVPAHTLAVDPVLLGLADQRIPAGAVVAAPSEMVAAALRDAGRPTVARPLTEVGAASVDAVALLDDELSRAGEHAEGLLAEAARALRPGGQLLVTVRNRVYAAAVGEELDGLRAYTADELDRALGNRGLRSELLCAPGASAGLAAGPQAFTAPAIDLDADRHPGLLDAAPRLLAVARAPGDHASRSRVFFSSLPRKVVAAAVVCRDPHGRMLIVHDSFKQHWTIPGGVVDADESPLDGAAREAWEETGLRVVVGPLLGVFVAAWPDRLVLVYGAEPADPATPPAPVHAHEIDDVAWVTVDEALSRVAPHIADQVRHCLDTPGGTWTLQRA